MNARLVGLSLLLSFISLAIRPPPASCQAQSDPVQVEMKGVRFHVDADIILNVTRLRGVMVGRVAGKPPVFDDLQSYAIRVDDGVATMDTTSLANLMNHHIFADEDAPLRDLSISIAPDGQLEMKGKVRKGVTVPFTMKASVSATDDGRMRLHVESLKAIGVPAKGLMGVFGLKLESLVDLKKRRDVTVEDNDIYVAPGQALPPPEIRGRLTKVAVDARAHAIVLTYAPADGRAPARLTLPAPAAKNYIYFGGGTIQFGKLTMTEADLQLIDADARDAFDFYPAKYEGQLIAGYSKNTPRHGLMTFMPDYDDLSRKRPQAVVKP